MRQMSFERTKFNFFSLIIITKARNQSNCLSCFALLRNVTDCEEPSSPSFLLESNLTS